MLRIVLTGGIASGKTTVSQLFGVLGTSVIDADQVSRELVQPGQAALAEIVAAFGNDMLDASGQLDRARLREQVFADPDKRKRLEGMLHPRIRERMLELADQARSPYALLVVPLLAETGGDYGADRVLLVDSSEQTQLERVMERDDCTAEQAQQILDAQASREQRLALADDVIDNDGGLADLTAAVKKMHLYYLSLSH